MSDAVGTARVWAGDGTLDSGATTGLCDCGITDAPDPARTVSGGWGDADCGLAWLASAFGGGPVTGLDLSVSGGFLRSTRTGAPSGSVDLYAPLPIDAVFLLSDYTTTDNLFYLNFAAPGTASANYIAFNAATSELFWSTGDSVFCDFSGQALWFRVQVSADLTARIKSWDYGTVQPSSWDSQVTGLDPIDIPALSFEPDLAGVDGTTFRISKLSIQGVDRCTRATFEAWDRIRDGLWDASTDGHAWINGTTLAGHYWSGVEGSDGYIQILSGATLNQGTAWISVGPGPWTDPAGMDLTGTFRVTDVSPGESRVFFRMGVVGHGTFESPYAGGDLDFDQWLFSSGTTVTDYQSGNNAPLAYADGTLWHYRWQYDYANGINRIRFWADGNSEPTAWDISAPPTLARHDDNGLQLQSHNNGGGAGAAWTMRFGPINSNGENCP